MGEQGARFDEEGEEDEGAVQGEGCQVQVLEGGCVGFGEVFARFACHFDSFDRW